MPDIADIRDAACESFTGPAVWHGPDLADREDWVMRLAGRQIGELTTALRTARRRGATLLRMTAADFPLPTLACALPGALEVPAAGRGFVLIKGIPVGEFGEADAGTVLRGIGQYLGRPVPQNADGHTLCHVRDTGGTAADRGAPGYRTRGTVPFHTAESDLLGLLCLRPARSCGDASLVSAAALHNAVAELRPDLVERLYRTHFFDRRDEHPLGEHPYLAASLATRYGAVLSMRYDRRRLEAARGLAGAPEPEAADTELYDLVDALAASPPPPARPPPRSRRPAAGRQPRHHARSLGVRGLRRPRTQAPPAATVAGPAHGHRSAGWDHPRPARHGSTPRSYPTRRHPAPEPADHPPRHRMPRPSPAPRRRLSRTEWRLPT